MSYSIHNEILKTAIQLKLEIRELAEPEREQIRIKVCEKFAMGRIDWLWENTNSAVSIRDRNGWKWIDSYLNGIPILMFFNFCDDKSIFSLSHYTSIVDLLGETSGFEFYITNHELSFLICFNHHDYLVAMGAAEDWLRQLKQPLGE